MLYLVLAALALAVLLLGMLLMRVLRQLNAWADLLEATDEDSNIRLPGGSAADFSAAGLSRNQPKAG